MQSVLFGKGPIHIIVKWVDLCVRFAKFRGVGCTCKRGVTGISALNWVEWYASCSSCFISEERAPLVLLEGAECIPQHCHCTQYSPAAYAVTNRHTDRFSRTWLSTIQDCFSVLLQSLHWIFWGLMQQHQIVKVKVKFTLKQAIKTQRWSGGIALLFL
jgi:hypothetical protein